MEYFRSRELFLLLVWGMLSSLAREQHLSNVLGGAVSQSLELMTEACGVSFTENICAHVHALNSTDVDVQKGGCECMICVH